MKIRFSDGFIFIGPLVIGIVLGWFAPYFAWKLSEYAILALFALMFLAGWGQGRPIVKVLNEKLTFKDIIKSLLLFYLVYPLFTLLVAQFFLSDPNLIFGVFFSSLMPVALVIPYFSQKILGRSQVSYQMLLISTLVQPVVVYGMLKVLDFQQIKIDLGHLFFLNTILVIVAPSLGWLLGRKSQKWFQSSKSYLGILNSVCLGFLVFVFFGSVSSKANLRQLDGLTTSVLFLFALFQNFGTYGLQRFVGRWLFEEKMNSELALSFGMRNTAIGIGPLLLTNPQSAVPLAFVFLAHCFYLLWTLR